MTRRRKLIRSDHLGRLTPPGREALVAYGVSTIIDLRSPGEVAASPSPFAGGGGPAYLHRALIDDADMREIGDATGMFERYLMMIEGRPSAFRAIFEAVAAAEGAVLFHCYAGKDRTGLVAAMLLAMAGVPNADIAADYGETDQRLARLYESLLIEAKPESVEAMRAELSCPPERILGVLEHVARRWGGVEGYLEASGMAPADIERVGSRLA